MAEITYLEPTGVAAPPEPYTHVIRAGTMVFVAGQVAFDSAGRLYIVDQNNGRIRRVGTDGTISTFAAGFSMPRDVAVDRDGNVYVADETANKIRRVDAAGHAGDFAGTGSAGLSGDGGPANQARIKGPRGVAYDAATDTVLIGDTANSRIRSVALSG